MYHVPGTVPGTVASHCRSDGALGNIGTHGHFWFSKYWPPPPAQPIQSCGSTIMAAGITGYLPGHRLHFWFIPWSRSTVWSRATDLWMLLTDRRVGSATWSPWTRLAQSPWEDVGEPRAGWLISVGWEHGGRKVSEKKPPYDWEPEG